jgi:hypothetical protein
MHKTITTLALAVALSLFLAVSAFAYGGYARSAENKSVEQREVKKRMANNLKLTPSQTELWNSLQLAFNNHMAAERDAPIYATNESAEQRRSYRIAMRKIHVILYQDLHGEFPDFTDIDSAAKVIYQGKSQVTFNNYIDERAKFFATLSPVQIAQLDNTVAAVKRENRRGVDF